jgi:hypothetical protein
MADYFPEISRAITQLQTNDIESRRALYERARIALVEQLRDILNDSQLRVEQMDLEKAIRRVELAALFPRAKE